MVGLVRPPGTLILQTERKNQPLRQTRFGEVVKSHSQEESECEWVQIHDLNLGPRVLSGVL